SWLVKKPLDYMGLTPSQVTSILKETFNQISSLFMDYNFLALMPRMDFKGLGYVPQIFCILPKSELISMN
ncbi:DUF792 family protein, partial [Borrelia persica]|uniref:DUF792 family protein n=1 Tax=Borrelia persica TaxID=44448 RepID=UPI00056FA782